MIGTEVVSWEGGPVTPPIRGRVGFATGESEKKTRRIDGENLKTKGRLINLARLDPETTRAVLTIGGRACQCSKKRTSCGDEVLFNCGGKDVDEDMDKDMDKNMDKNMDQ